MSLISSPLSLIWRGWRNIKIVLSIVSLFIFISPLVLQAYDYPVTVTDFRGKTITFTKPVGRIVCLIESALSGLYMLNQAEKIVGISKNVYQSDVYKYYAQLDNRIKNRTLPAPGNWDFVSIESVVNLKPDLVIIWASQTEAIKALEQRGITVYGVFILSIQDVYKEIMDFGKITGSVKRSKELIDFVKDELSALQKRVKAISAENRKKVYFMWAQGLLNTSCKGSTVEDLITIAGGINSCTEIVSEHAVVSLEKLIRWNPDIIVMWVNERKNPEDIKNEPQLKRIKAIKSNQVYELPEIFLCDLWTLKFYYAAKLLAKWTYPEIFRDVDLEKEKLKMLKKFYGIDLKIDR